MTAFTQAFDTAVSDGLAWLSDHGSGVFGSFGALLTGAYGGIERGLGLLPWWTLALAMALAGALLVGRLFAVGALAGLWLCQAMALWPQTVSTLALVSSSTLLALLVAVPVGIVVGLFSRLSRAMDVVLDFVQTMPPYIYLLPGIALLGYGPATAMWATWVVAIAPALRLTAHGVRMTPRPFIELGVAVGMTPAQQLWRIRVPFALSSLLAGINQSLMLSFAMVVIAGIAGSGGLGQTIYDAVRTLKIDRAIDAGIAIVVLTIVLDRLTQRLGRRTEPT